MKQLWTWAAAALVLAMTAVSQSPVWAANTASVLAGATTTVGTLKHDPIFSNARATLRNARAVLIVPNLVKGGFLFGAEGGEGVLLARTPRGWSQPAFYTLGSASFGLQIGLEQAQLVMFVMSDRALRGIEEGKFKIGAGAGLTVVTLGANAEAATATNLSGDLIVWSVAKGAYGGLTLNGSVVAPQDSDNGAFYGRKATVSDILMNRVTNPATAALRTRLASVW